MGFPFSRSGASFNPPSTYIFAGLLSFCNGISFQGYGFYETLPVCPTVILKNNTIVLQNMLIRKEKKDAFIQRLKPLVFSLFVIKWIDVNDKLPNENEYVLICIDDYIGISSLINGEWDCGVHHKRPMFRIDKAVRTKLDAEYWMPLPEPPRGIDGMDKH